MFKKPLLIGLPRTGTTWVQQYIRTAYSRYGITLPGNSDDEWFAKHYKHDNIQTKIDLIETARANNLEVCVKVLINDVRPIWPWFKEFYKNADIIILKRRNLWKTYISWLFHRTIDSYVLEHFDKQLTPTTNQWKINNTLHPWHLITPTDEDVLKSTIQYYNVAFTFNDNIWKDFIAQVTFLEDEVKKHFTSAQVWWLEDLTDQFLEDRFKRKPKVIIKPFKRLNYEVYYSTKELQHIKDVFKEWFEENFISYAGYEM